VQFIVGTRVSLGLRHLWDDSGKRYIDFTSGIAVCSLGHCRKEIVEAVKEQAAELFHISNLYWTAPQAELARILCRHSFADKVFFCNSGAESVEAAIKLARKYGHDTRGPDCFEIICLEGSFHGRTLAAITATGQPVYQRGFEPLPDGFTHVPPNDIGALELAAGKRTAAILMEPILGEGGVIALHKEFLQAAREMNLDPAESFVVGDRWSDIKTAANCGARSVLVRTGYGRGDEQYIGPHQEIQPDHKAEDLLEAVDWILKNIRM